MYISNATLWFNLQDLKISNRAEIPKLDRVQQAGLEVLGWFNFGSTANLRVQTDFWPIFAIKKEGKTLIIFHKGAGVG